MQLSFLVAGASQKALLGLGGLPNSGLTTIELYKGSKGVIGIMEQNMDATIWSLGFRVLAILLAGIILEHWRHAGSFLYALRLGLGNES